MFKTIMMTLKLTRQTDVGHNTRTKVAFHKGILRKWLMLLMTCCSKLITVYAH